MESKLMLTCLAKILDGLINNALPRILNDAKREAFVPKLASLNHPAANLTIIPALIFPCFSH
jgi:hypothetical protein